MTRPLRVSLIAIVALVVALALVPTPAAAARVVVVRSYPAWGWGWGPSWYGPAYWGPGYYYAPRYAPYMGKVKIHTPDKEASVYVDGGYAGPVAKMKKFSLRPGTHELALKGPGGATVFDRRIEVLQGKTTEVYAG